MDPVKRKVLSNIFLAPSVVLPVISGLGAGVMSWASGGVTALSVAAVAGLLGGLGWMLTRLVFRVEHFTAEAIQLQQEQKVREQNLALDQLGRQLRLHVDGRTQDYLTLLRSLRDDFLETAGQQGIELRSGEIREQLEQVFQAAVDRLREVLRLSKLADSLASQERKTVLADREKIVEEMAQTINQMQTSVSHFKQFVKKEPQSDLASLREELETSLRVAKRTEERVKELDNLHSSDQSDSFSRE